MLLAFFEELHDFKIRMLKSRPSKNDGNKLNRNRMAFISISQEHIDLLRRAASANFPTKIYPGQKGVDFVLYQDLVSEHLVNAKESRDGMKIVMYIHSGVTEKGFSVLEKHRDKQEEATSIGWIRQNRTWLAQQGISFIFGVAAGLIIARFSDWLK